MLRWNAVLLTLCISSAGLYAGEPLFVPHGAAEMGMAFAVTATPGHWSCFSNQALLTAASETGFSASFENRFMIPAMSSKAVSAVIVNRPAPLGIIAAHYGNGDYYRLFAGAGSAVTITDAISLGLQVDYIAEHGIGDYHDLSHVTFEAGMTCKISRSIMFGVHLFNPMTPLNSIPSSIETGLNWKHSDNLFLSFSGAKMTGEPLSLQCGLSWHFIDRVVIRCGYMSSPSSYAFGMGFRAGPFRADAGFLVSSLTGVTSSLSITWTID